MIHVFPAEKNNFLNVFQMSDFQENGFLFGTLVSTISIYYKELISKLAQNWLTNVKVIDLTFFDTGPLVYSNPKSVES